MHSRIVLCALALVAVSAAAQEPASVTGFSAYHAAETCMAAFGRRFAATPANPQDVADAALEACFQKRYAAAAEKIRRMGAPAGTAGDTAVDAPELRRVAILALLEARYPRAR